MIEYNNVTKDFTPISNISFGSKCKLNVAS